MAEARWFSLARPDHAAFQLGLIIADVDSGIGDAVEAIEALARLSNIVGAADDLIEHFMDPCAKSGDDAGAWSPATLFCPTRLLAHDAPAFSDHHL